MDNSNSEVVMENSIKETVIRPVIARSWNRCRNVDVYSKNLHCIPERMLQARRVENITLISLSRTVSEEIAAINPDTFVLLCDTEGYVLECYGNPKYCYLAGQRFCETDMGTNAIGTTLVEKVPVDINGDEHYCVHLHNYYGAATPIYNSCDDIIGVLAVYSNGFHLQAGILHTLNLGARVIKNYLDYKARESKVLTNYHNTCSSIIDYFNDGFIVVDNRSNIANINQKCLDIMNLPSRKSLIGVMLENIIADGNEVLGSLLSENPTEFTSHFNLKGSNEIISCNLINRRIVKNRDGTKQTILIFNTDDKMNRSQINACTSSSESISTLNDLIGESQVWNRVKTLVKKAAEVSFNVLIEGESGTGKELVARAIHRESGRNGQFIAINCGAIPKELLQSELFGYEEGSFTGAKKGGCKGKFEDGDGGAVFLDEIGEMPLDMQVSLLRFLQDGVITRIGSSRSKRVDVRIIAATNRNLKKEVLSGTFREDLYYRLSVINLPLPALRERKTDIPLITRYLIGRICRQLHREPLYISDAAMDILCAYRWPGNVRELNNILENAIVFTEGNLITEYILPAHLLKNGEKAPSIQDSSLARDLPDIDSSDGLTIEQARNISKKLNALQEQDEIMLLLKRYQGNVSQVARHMGLSRNTLYRKMRQYKIQK